jgi:hypothetical protein
MLEFQKMNELVNPSPDPEPSGEQHMKLHRTLFALLVALTTTALPLAAQTKDFSQHIVWNGPMAIFIPGKLLDGADLKTFPVPQNQLEDLIALEREKRELRLQASSQVDACIKLAEAGLSSWSRQAARTVGVGELLANRAFVFRGTVVATEAGWKNEFVPRVVTLVYITVEELLACDFGHLEGIRQTSIGDTIAIEMDKGSFEMNGLRLCNATDDILDIPKVGDMVIGAGFPYQFDPYYAGPGEIFRIHLGEVLPQPYEDLGLREPKALWRIRENLGADLIPSQTCEGSTP